MHLRASKEADALWLCNTRGFRTFQVLNRNVQLGETRQHSNAERAEIPIVIQKCWMYQKAYVHSCQDTTQPLKAHDIFNPVNSVKYIIPATWLSAPRFAMSESRDRFLGKIGVFIMRKMKVSFWAETSVPLR